MVEVFLATVVIPTHNRELLLARAVASALARLPEGCEVVVVDDGSAPLAEPALRAVIGPEPRLRVIRNEGAHGAAIARNLGVGAARGVVIFFLDDDDVLMPGYVAGVLAARDMAERDFAEPDFAEPGTGARNTGAWGFSPALTHAADAAPVLAVVSHVRLIPVPGPLGRAHLTGLGYGFWVVRAQFQAVGGLDPDLAVNEDTDLCLRLLSAGLLPSRATVAGVSLGLRTEGAPAQAASVTQRVRAADRAGYFARILDRHAVFLAGTPGLRAFMLKRQVKMLAKSGQIGAGLRLAIAARKPGLALYALLNAALYARRW